MDLRLAHTGDAAGVLAIYAPVVASTAISFEMEPPTESEMTARIGERLPVLPWLVAEHDHEILGYAYAGRFAPRGAYRWSVETSVYVAAHQRGRGLGRAIYRSLLAVLAAQGYRQALAGIALPNPGSVALHENLGFERAGLFRRVGWKLDRWWDVSWWQRELQAGPGAPVTVLAVDALPAPVLSRALLTGVADLPST